MVFDNMLYKVVFDYVKKVPYTGSFNNKRFRIWTEEGSRVMASVYPDEFCYEKTPEEAKLTKEFAYSKEGLDEACSFIEGEIA